MLDADFAGYSLALIKDGKVLYSSTKSGLRPLVECVIKHKGKFNNCILYDKIMGLAAARIVVYCGFISSVVSKTASKSAKELLEKNNINLKTENIVENILNNDKSGICPGELKAQQITDNKAFFSNMKDLFAV